MFNRLLAFAKIFCISTALLVFAAFVPNIAYAQVNSEIANCEELKDPDTSFQAELCSSHAGCKLVFAIQKTCNKVKKFLNGLKDAIGEGTKTFFGYRKEVTPDAIFEASLSDNLKSGVNKPELAENAKTVKEKVRNAGKSEMAGAATDGGTWQYYGDVTDGKQNGVGTMIFSNGTIRRGVYVDGQQKGLNEVMVPDSSRYLGNYEGGVREGTGANVNESGSWYTGRTVANKFVEGKLVLASGVRFEGTFKDSSLDAGKIYEPNGKLRSEGQYEKGVLVDGKRYDSSGQPTVVTTLRDREAAAVASAAAAEERNRRQREDALAASAVAERQQREAKAREEQQFRDSLNTMNAGQLFAKADELSSKGDSAKAREVLRALISRFPNHQLATTAAQRLSGGGEQVASRNISAKSSQTTELRESGGRSSSAPLELTGNYEVADVARARGLGGTYDDGLNCKDLQNSKALSYSRPTVHRGTANGGPWDSGDGQSYSSFDAAARAACIREARRQIASGDLKTASMEAETNAPPKASSQVCLAEVRKVDQKVAQERRRLVASGQGSSLSVGMLSVLIAANTRTIEALTPCESDPPIKASIDQEIQMKRIQLQLCNFHATDQAACLRMPPGF